MYYNFGGAVMVMVRQTNHTPPYTRVVAYIAGLGQSTCVAKVNKQLLPIQTNHIIGLPVYLLKLEIANHDF